MSLKHHFTEGHHSLPHYIHCYGEFIVTENSLLRRVHCYGEFTVLQLIHRRCNSPPTGIPRYKNRIPPPKNIFSSTSSSSNSGKLNQQTSIFIDHNQEAFITLWHSFLHCIHCMSPLHRGIHYYICVIAPENSLSCSLFTEGALHLPQASPGIKGGSLPSKIFFPSISSSSNTIIQHQDNTSTHNPQTILSCTLYFTIDYTFSHCCA